MLKFSAVSQIWKKYNQKLNDWDLPLSKHQIICVYVSTNCHKCAECANTIFFLIYKNSTGGINWKLLQDIIILGTST